MVPSSFTVSLKVPTLVPAATTTSRSSPQMPGELASTWKAVGSPEPAWGTVMVDSAEPAPTIRRT
jgi:hypothetical protein